MSSIEKDREEEEEDYFDLLPDPILLLIFNKLNDAKSLTLCLSVSKRFASLVFQTNSIFLSIPPRIPNSKPTHKLLPFNLFKILFHKFIAKPLQFFHHIKAYPNNYKSNPNSDSGNISYYSPNEVLKQFKDVKSLHIEVPSHGLCGKIGFEEEGIDSLLKWKAEFGGELKNCVVLVASSFQACKDRSYNKKEDNLDQVLTDEELRLRVAWTISCLVDASARHWLLKKILTEHQRLENVIISDVNKQGKLCLSKDQLLEMKNEMKPLEALESSLERSRVPDLRMKLWYCPELELPETGYLMKGATLVVIKPAADGGVLRKGSDDYDYNGDLFGFDGEECEKKAFDEAVKEMMKMKKKFVLTMNSF